MAIGRVLAVVLLCLGTASADHKVPVMSRSGPDIFGSGQAVAGLLESSDAAVAIDKVVADAAPKLLACYRGYLNTEPGLLFSAFLTFQISASGVTKNITARVNFS